jgi:hypothetical protein
VWWCSSAILTLGRQRQEDEEFKAILGYTLKSSLKKKEKKKKIKRQLKV